LPIPQSLRRLHSIRSAEEQQFRTHMISAFAELRSLQNALERTQERLRLARTLIANSVRTAESEDRIAGLEEAAQADRLTRLLRDRIRVAEQHFVRSRAQFLEKRVERRQVETLLDAARKRDAVEESRKAQIALDEWFRTRPREKSDQTRCR
jgi:hypothetical protein